MINQQLEELFRRWKAASESFDEPREQSEAREVIFTKDGLLLKYDAQLHEDCAAKTKEDWETMRQAAMRQVEEKWQQAPMRIAVLLKDQPSQWSDDLRNWLVPAETDFADAAQVPKRLRRKAKNRNLDISFMFRLASIFWGLTHATRENSCWYGEWPEASLKELFHTLPFALVECKKQGGGSSISDKVLETYLNRYEVFLWEELNILRPNVIVCTSEVIYHYVLTHYFDGELEKVDAAHNSVRYHRRSKTLVFCSFHPSMRKYHETFYEGVMNHFRAFLTKHTDFASDAKWLSPFE